MLTPTCFDISVSSSGSFKNLYCAKLRKFFKLKRLKLQFHKIISLKVFGCRIKIHNKVDSDFRQHNNILF